MQHIIMPLFRTNKNVLCINIMFFYFVEHYYFSKIDQIIQLYGTDLIQELVIIEAITQTRIF